jgi:DNA-binding transcriptional regulator YiaG
MNTTTSPTELPATLSSAFAALADIEQQRSQLAGKHSLAVQNIGRTMKTARENRGVSLRRLAEEMGISNNYLSDMEQGKRLYGLDYAKCAIARLDLLAPGPTPLVWRGIKPNEAALHRPHEVGSVARAGSSAKRMDQHAATEEPPHSSAKRMNS